MFGVSHFTSRRAHSLAARFASVALLLAVLSGVASACPTCKQALLENDPNGRSLISGYFFSILFMMSAPFAVLGTFCGMAFISIRRAKNAPTDAHNTA